MPGYDLERDRILSEITLADKAYDFMAKFMAVYSLQSLTKTNPEVIKSDTISILEKVLIDSEFSHQIQAYFMYKEVASTLCSVIIHSKDLAAEALTTLKNLLALTNGHPHRATAEALGALPFTIRGPVIRYNGKKEIPCVMWKEICDQVNFDLIEPPQVVGRSLVASAGQRNQLLVIKLARAGESLESLYAEAFWMEYLQTQVGSFPIRFDVPKAIEIHGSHAFMLKEIPVKIPGSINVHPKGYAIGFLSDEDYFTYPNDTKEEKQLAKQEVKEVISRNAWLLGNLASVGIIHSAPVPLFHNRVQRYRRRDQGLYEWPRAGRLDRWLESCLHPNLGLTGLRDFEHLVSFKGASKNLYRYIGIHMLSMLLIAGSYFRNKESYRVGFDNCGNPVDARDLFDKKFLKELIHDIFCNYYNGFVGKPFEGKLPIDLDKLAGRMIDEMGIDSHMEEILRVTDQNEMTNEEFKAFLRGRGLSIEKIDSFQKGARDIVIHSGPHLGEFNHRISLPELIEAVGTMSSLCIAGRYCSIESKLQ